MEKSTLKRLIVEYQQVISGLELVERDHEFADGLNYVVVGLRRAGKSFMLYQQMQRLEAQGHLREEMLYMNFEDDRLGSLSLPDLDLLKTSYEELYPHRPIFFLDEIQNVEGWEHFARRLADQHYRVYITGSNARMLSMEIAGTLGGRFMVEPIGPYSFREYLRACGMRLEPHWDLSAQRNEVVRRYGEYLHYGGLPEVQQLPLVTKRTWLSNLFNKIFFGDILMRYAVRNSSGLKVLLRKLAESVKQPCSYTRLANIVSSAGVKVHVETIIDYLEYAKESCIIFEVENYAAKIAERAANKKYYFADNGLLGLFLFDPLATLLENIVAVKLHSLGEEVCFYHDGIEVDFYLWEQRTAIQVACSLTDAGTRERETKALLKLARRHPVEHMLIITYDEEGTLDMNGYHISVVPAWRWLLA